MEPIKEGLSPELLPQSDPTGSSGHDRAPLKQGASLFYFESGIDWGLVLVFVGVGEGLRLRLCQATRLLSAAGSSLGSVSL